MLALLAAVMLQGCALIDADPCHGRPPVYGTDC